MIPLQFLLTHSSKQTDVILLDRFRAASLPKLADLAMGVERKPRWLASSLD
jgi:hypothetical protein